MTSGKKADSAMPKNQRIAKRPPKLYAAADNKVNEPKVNMSIGRTLAGPKRFPSMASGGAKITYGTKKMDSSRLYWSGLKWRSLLSPSVSAFPRLPLSRALKRSTTLVHRRRHKGSKLTHQRQDRKQAQIESATQSTLRSVVDHLDDILDDARCGCGVMAVLLAGFKAGGFAIVRDIWSHGDDLPEEHRV